MSAERPCPGRLVRGWAPLGTDVRSVQQAGAVWRPGVAAARRRGGSLDCPAGRRGTAANDGQGGSARGEAARVRPPGGLGHCSDRPAG